MAVTPPPVDPGPAGPGAGDDDLVGTSGPDTISLGLGNDTFAGGAGADLAYGNPGSEGDRIALGGQTYTVSSAQNGDALLPLPGGGVIELSGIRADQVNAGSFAA